MFDQTLSIILAGGAGSRLHPLTAERAKPAVPFGGKYRIIDFALSNCLHSGLRRILVLTQYKSHSLQKHLRDGWSIFSPEVSEYITPIPPQMRTGNTWYVGTADAIMQNLYLLERSRARYVLILSGDHIYRMDYAAMLQFHRDQGAELTIACMEVPKEEARSFGVMAVDEHQRVCAFQEKPNDPRTLPNHPDRALASMGIYVFDLALLAKVLKEDHLSQTSTHDFGKDIIPSLIEHQRVFAYSFGGESGRVTQDRYWRDVGTVDSYYAANMDLLLPVPPIDLYQRDWPIRTYPGQNPPARIVPSASGHRGEFDNSLMCGGSVICGGIVRHSILSSQVRVDDGALVENSILLEGVHVGEGAEIRRAIIDKGVHIPPGEQIGGNPEVGRMRFSISDHGITVVPKGYRF